MDNRYVFRSDIEGYRFIRLQHNGSRLRNLFIRSYSDPYFNKLKLYCSEKQELVETIFKGVFGEAYDNPTDIDYNRYGSIT